MEIKCITFIAFYALCTTAAGATNSTDGKQTKRGTSELSYSYAATDIGAKGGTHIKTITIIKNYGQKDKLKINPELHKDEDWGSKFRDNFDSFGKIPEIPDVLNADFLKKGEKSSPEEKPKLEIPIYEETNEEEKIVDQNQSNAEATDEPEEEDQSKENPEVEQDAMLKSEKIADDVEVIETKVKNDKQDDKNTKSQQIVSLIPNINRSQKYTHQSSVLHTQPYHQILKTAYVNPQVVAYATSTSVPHKNPENLKITYSPLVFPPIPIQPIISSTTQIQAKNNIRRYQSPSTTQLPYIAPNIIRSYKSNGSTTSGPSPEETSNVIYEKIKPVFPSRSRGLRYK